MQLTATGHGALLEHFGHRIGSIDCGCVMVRREEALAIGWTSTESAADWVYIDALASAYGLDRFLKLPRPLFVHN